MFAKKLLWAALLMPVAAQASIDIQRWTTAEGTQILLVERHENPIVDMRISFKGAGSVFNPAGKGELAEFAAALLLSGTEKLDEEAFHARSNDLAVDIGSSSGEETAALTFRSLSRSENLLPTLDLVNQALVSPRFDTAVFERNRSQSITALQQSERKPGFVADRALTRLMYPDHPYGNGANVSVESLGKMSLDDIRAFYRSRYGKQNAVVAIVGDVDRQQAEKMVAKALDKLPQKPQHGHAVAPVPEQKARHQAIPFPGEQAQIVMGMPLIKRHDPDYYALVAGNYVLGGGGFDSRLMKVLRDRHGYTYGAYSRLSPMTEAGGLGIAFSTKKANAAPALAAAKKVLAGFIAEGPTEAELKQAKDNIIGSFPLRFDSNAKLLNYLSLIGVHNLPSDYLEAYPKAIEALTAEQVKEVWQRRVNPNKLHTVIVGGKAKGKAE